MKVEIIKTETEKKIYRFSEEEIEAILFEKIGVGREFADTCEFYGDNFRGAAVIIKREITTHDEKNI
jgi:hypothetical protein